MYKILTKLHTSKPGVFHIHMVKNADGEWVEYQAETKDEVELEALKLLKHIGCDDLRVIVEEPYYVDLQYEEDPDFNEQDEKAKVLGLIKHTGWGDLKISDNKPFSIDMIWGVREEVVVRHTITMITPENCVCEPMKLESIIPGSSRSLTVTFTEPVKSFHLIVNGEECLGIPPWIDYIYLTDTQGVFTFNSITNDYEVEIVVDAE